MRILYATDGSGPAREGERLIWSLFDAGKARIHVFSVAPESEDGPALPNGESEPAERETPVLSWDQVAKESARQLVQKGFHATSSSNRGHPGAEILRMADSGGFELIVMGASHTTWMGNLMLGSVSTFVLHHAPCSVLVTHRAPAGNGSVLGALDGSRAALSALGLAAEVLDSSRCSVEVATVVTHPWGAGVYLPVPPFGGHVPQGQQLDEEAIARGWMVAQRGSTFLRARGFETEEAVLLGRPTHQLLKEADNISADLVVAGSRGLGPVRRTFLGSVSDQLVRHAPATLVSRAV